VNRDAYRWGVERRVTVMFADLRGFTTLAERLYPYDSVFLLNRYFEVMSDAIERHGGEVDKFLGDGVMALFGVSPAQGSGSRGALGAAQDMFAALDRLNGEFEATLPEPFAWGSACTRALWCSGGSAVGCRPGSRPSGTPSTSQAASKR
jgi:adenylate cyclase